MANQSVRFDFIGRDVSASRTAGRVGKNFDGLGRRMRGFGLVAGAAIAAAGVGVVRFGADAVKTAATFDQTMRQVAANAKVPAAGLKNLSKLALDMGAKTTFSAQQAAQAMLELSKGGMTIAQIKAGVLKETLTLAAAGGLELADAATYMSNSLNSFGLQAKDAAGVAAALAGGANASTASVESLGLALSQVGPGARTAGLSLQETVAVLSAFDNAGIKGADAGTSLKTMLTRLVPVTAKAKNAMADLGLKFTDASGTMLPIPVIAQRIQTAFKGLSDAERTKAMATIFGSDATRAATVLMEQGAVGINKYIKATNDRGAAEAMAKARTDGAAGAFERLKGSIETIKIQVGTALLPTLANLANFLSGTLIPGVQAFAVTYGPGFKRAFAAIADFVKGRVIPALQSFAAFVASTVIPNVIRAAAFVRGQLAPSIATLSQRFRENRPQIMQVVGALQSLGKFALGVALPAMLRLAAGLRPVITTAGDVVVGIGQIVRVISVVAGAVGTAVAAIERLIGAIGRIPRSFSITPHINLPNLPKIPGLHFGASGGIVTRPTLAMIGERGPEAVTPLHRAPGARPLGAGGAVTINVFGVTDPRAVALKVRDELVRHQGRNGTTGLR